MTTARRCDSCWIIASFKSGCEFEIEIEREMAEFCVEIFSLGSCGAKMISEQDLAMIFRAFVLFTLSSASEIALLNDGTRQTETTCPLDRAQHYRTVNMIS